MFKQFSTLLAGAVVIALSAIQVTPTHLHAQTLDEVIAKANDARGGVAKLKAVQSAVIAGIMTFQGGQVKITYQMQFKRPKMFRFDQTFQGMTITQSYDGKTGWQTNPFQGIRDPQMMDEEALKEMEEQADLIDGSFIDSKEKGYTLELMGKEEVEGSGVYKVKTTRKDGSVTYEYLDEGSFLTVKTISKRKDKKSGTETESEQVFGNYKTINGIVFPGSIEFRAGGKTQGQMTMDTIELGKAVDNTVFAMPAKKEEKK